MHPKSKTRPTIGPKKYMPIAKHRKVLNEIQARCTELYTELGNLQNYIHDELRTKTKQQKLLGQMNAPKH